MFRYFAVILCACVVLASPSLAQVSPDYQFRVDSVSRNTISSYSSQFGSKALYDVAEITKGPGIGQRFIVDKYTTTTLQCNAGLLNNYGVTVEGAGVVAGSECAVLPTDQLWPAEEDAFGEFTYISDSLIGDADGAWVEDEFEGQYLYLRGHTTVGSYVISFFSITGNDANTISVDASLSSLPAYDNTDPDLEYLILTNPPNVQTKPQIQLGTDFTTSTRRATAASSWGSPTHSSPCRTCPRGTP